VVGYTFTKIILLWFQYREMMISILKQVLCIHKLCIVLYTRNVIRDRLSRLLLSSSLVVIVVAFLEPPKVI